MKQDVMKAVLGLAVCVASCNPSPPPAEEAASAPDPGDEEDAVAEQSAASLFGHFAFPETTQPLVDAGAYRDSGRIVRLRTEAAEVFQAMQQAARDEGVHLVPISGFRTVDYQEGLFSRAIDRYATPEEAALWVAPPGYSEHHTGLALDVGDLNRPETDVETTFEQTPASEWLGNNAHRFGFALSFPEGNPQGVSYEPWHWRFTAVSAEATPATRSSSR